MFPVEIYELMDRLKTHVDQRLEADRLKLVYITACKQANMNNMPYPPFPRDTLLAQYVSSVRVNGIVIRNHYYKNFISNK
jgi:hypothetical protein